MKKKIAVFFGGCSSEHEVSLQSAFSVISNLDPEKYDIIMIGINRQGNWFLFEGDPKLIADDAWEQDAYATPAMLAPSREIHGIVVFRNEGAETISIDAAFPVLHGKNGEDGTIQGLMELAGIPIVGCDLLSSALCMDKVRAHAIVENLGIKVPRSVEIYEGEPVEPVIEKLREFNYPVFVKPVNAGSSIGMSKIHDEALLEEAIKMAFEHDKFVTIEEGIDGFEVGCAILGNRDLIISPVDEIELFIDFFDYTEKYTQNFTKIHFPARIDDETAEKIRETAGRVYKALGCRGFARVDLFLNSKKEIVFNEVNTIPGMTTHSRYPNMLKGLGITYPALMDKLVELAFEA